MASRPSKTMDHCLFVLVLALLAPSLPGLHAADLYVAQDGSGNFRTVGEAVNAAQGQTNIYIRAGVYFEKVAIPSTKSRISLFGVPGNPSAVVIRYNDYSGRPLPDGSVIGTSTSYTLLAHGTDFYAQDLTIENSAGDIAQAVALHVKGDRAVIRNCRLIGNQDTLYVHDGDRRQHYIDTYIEGTTDFIFGAAIAVFDRCTLHSKKNSYITAASTPQGQRYGLVFRDCTLTANSAATSVYLGRPWRPDARTVFLNTRMDSHIRPEGWHNWGDPANERTAFYAEYNSWGSGANPNQRVWWSHQLTASQAAEYYNIDGFFARDDPLNEH